ncbi:MAG: hypothetical protein QM737_04640 [Ferruginibacter sp.]
MKTFFKKHRAMSVTFPAFVLYILLLPKDMNNINKDKKDIHKTDEPGLKIKNIPKPESIDKTYAASWIFRINTNQ